jgi:hypothetical protein
MVSKQEMFLKVKPFIIEYISLALLCVLGFVGAQCIRTTYPLGFVFSVPIIVCFFLHFINQTRKVFTDLYKGDLVSGTFQLSQISEKKFEILLHKKYYDVEVNNGKQISLNATDFPGDMGNEESIAICYFKRSKIIANISTNKNHDRHESL